MIATFFGWSEAKLRNCPNINRYSNNHCMPKVWHFGAFIYDPSFDFKNMDMDQKLDNSDGPLMILKLLSWRGVIDIYGMTLLLYPLCSHVSAKLQLQSVFSTRIKFGYLLLLIWKRIIDFRKVNKKMHFHLQVISISVWWFFYLHGDGSNTFRT